MSALQLRMSEVAPVKAEIRLGQAIADFIKDLSKEHKASYDANRNQFSGAPPTSNDIMLLTADIDRRVASKVGVGRCLGTRLVNVLDSIQKFVAMADFLVAGSQDMVAIGVWSFVRMTLLALVNASTWLDKLSEFFMRIGRSAPRHEKIVSLYPDSKNLRSYLCDYFLIIVRVCNSALKISQKSVLGQFVSFLGESEMKQRQADLDQLSDEIKDEMMLLEAQERREENLRLAPVLKNTQIETKRREAEERQRILDACSTYDYVKTWKEIRRTGNTIWFAQQEVYQDWKTSKVSCTLLYSGKLGSGKSITLANMVQDASLGPDPSSNPLVAYFFCRYDDRFSLQEAEVLGSLARQLLSSIKVLTTAGVDISEPLDSTDMLTFLKHNISQDTRAYFILDGLDECDADCRELVLQNLRQIQSLFPLRICVSHRKEADNALYSNLQRLCRSSMLSIPEENPDIACYIEAELKHRCESGRLRVGDPGLISEIRCTLLDNSQGMFLWVALQIGSLCMARTDNAIRHALANLPKDLNTTFSRILQQAASLDLEGEENQRRTLELIISAFTPLTTDELREAVSVVVGQAKWDHDRLPNDMHAFLSCCGSLLIIDEETLSVRFTHHSVKQFLCLGSQVIGGHIFTTETANVAMTSVILTYLDYDVFDGQASRTRMPHIQRDLIPEKAIYSGSESMANRSQSIVASPMASKASGLDSTNLPAEDIQPSGKRLGDQFPFVFYAKRFWVEHMVWLREPSPTIEELFQRALSRGIINVNDTDALLKSPLSFAAGLGSEVFSRILLRGGAKPEQKGFLGRQALHQAIRNGHAAIVQLLLEHGAEIMAKIDDGSTALHLAAVWGYEAIAQLLLDKGADIDAVDDFRRTPLHKAVLHDHLAVVKLSLEQNAAVSTYHVSMRTPTYNAVEGEKAAIVKVLLDAPTHKKLTEDLGGLLQEAVCQGNEGIVQLLLENGADIESRDKSGLNPLCWAAGDGHEAVVRLLLESGAEIEPNEDDQPKSLLVAAHMGYEHVVRLLLDHGARTGMVTGVSLPSAV